jgi:glycosyltransferase involved in cell wall biosynthesis
VWKNKKISIIFPTYNEKDSIRSAVIDFFDTGVVDEIIVVNNNAASGTSEEIADTNAIEIKEPRQGYGRAIRTGIENATGDLLIVSEPDGTFVGRDVLKLLAYYDDGYDVVFGSRTYKAFIWEGANMGLLMKWGNIFVAKFLETLFASRCQLSDVGCTYRLITKQAYDRLTPYLTVDENHFSVDMMIHVLYLRMKVVEIPVNYLPRVGISSVTGHLSKAIYLGIIMYSFIIKKRLEYWLRPKREIS